MKKFISILIIIIVLFIAGFFSLSKNQNTISNGKLQVVASFYPMYFFSQQIGGDKAQVFNITPAASEPHDYEPTTQDIARITNAQMLVLNGGKLEAWGDKIKSQLSGTNVLVITAAKGLANKTLNENGQIIQDPHVWLDPILAKIEVTNIEKGFEKIDPKDSEYFKSNAQKLLFELDQLNQQYKIGLASCSKKDFVTSHAAFGYLSEQYNINQVPISGVSPDEEPSSQKLAEITNLVKTQNLKIVFFESLVSPKLSETIANETGAKAMVLDPIEGIPQAELDKGANYIGIMKNNLNNLQIALECK